jgi:hypothetical protein
MVDNNYPIPDLPIDETVYYEAVAGLSVQGGQRKEDTLESNGVYSSETYNEIINLFEKKNEKIMDEIEATMRDLQGKVAHLEKLQTEMLPYMEAMRKLYLSNDKKIVLYKDLLRTLVAISKANEAKQ